jgi:hypothetical protein
MVESGKVSCDGGGGALGHPKVYINLVFGNLCRIIIKLWLVGTADCGFSKRNIPTRIKFFYH